MNGQQERNNVSFMGGGLYINGSPHFILHATLMVSSGESVSVLPGSLIIIFPNECSYIVLWRFSNNNYISVIISPWHPKGSYNGIEASGLGLVYYRKLYVMAFD